MPPKHITRFQSEYQEYHQLSADRARQQVKEIERLQAFAKKPILKCESSDLRAYLASELDRGLDVNTIRKKLHMLTPWFGWAYDAGIITADQLLGIQRVSPPRSATNSGLPKPYTRKELDRFRKELDAALPLVDQKYWDRWRRGTSPYRRIQPEAMRIQIEAIVALALHCGLRRNEIFKASLDDIHYDNEYVVVRYPKGGAEKTRRVPHTPTSREAVRAWLELRAELGPKHDFTWLSLAWASVALTPMRWDRFRALLRKVVGPGWQLHRFRHTCGTEWLRAIKRIEIVSRLLGHSRIQQTMGYAQIVPDDLLLAVDKSQREFAEAVGA